MVDERREGCLGLHLAQMLKGLLVVMIPFYLKKAQGLKEFLPAGRLTLRGDAKEKRRGAHLFRKEYDHHGGVVVMIGAEHDG